MYVVALLYYIYTCRYTPVLMLCYVVSYVMLLLFASPLFMLLFSLRFCDEKVTSYTAMYEYFLLILNVCNCNLKTLKYFLAVMAGWLLLARISKKELISYTCFLSSLIPHSSSRNHHALRNYC